jgi:cystine transport system permease protein
MNFFQTYWRTIIPQAVRNVLPAIGNDYIGLMKDTSLVSVVTITELLRQGNIIARSSFSYLGPYIAVALMYWAMTFVSATILERIEKRLEGGRT